MKNNPIGAGLVLAASLLMTTAAGAAETETADLETIEAPERGLVYHVDSSYLDKGLYIDAYDRNLYDYPISAIYFIGDEANRIITELSEKPEDERTQESDQAAITEARSHTGNLLTIVLVEEDEYKKLTDQGTTADELSGYQGTEELGINDGYQYLYVKPEVDESAFTDEEKENCGACIDYLDEILDSIEYTDVEMEADDGTSLGSGIPAFETVDLDGNTVTNNLFAGKDVTVINVWGTFCGPCINEMPELAAWAGELPDNVQLVGLVGDVSGPDDSEHLSLAQLICEKAGVTYTNIIPDDSLREFLSGLIGYPTTFLVDGNGNLIGDPIIGAAPDEYKKAVEKALGETQLHN